MPPRVVFDTNIIISGLLWRGRPYYCLQAARAKVVQSVYCREMLAELAAKLRSKFGFSANRTHETLDDYRSWARRVDIQGDLHIVMADPDDDKFIECAQVAGARVIVSGDKHLLNLKEYEGIPILSAAEFLEWVAGLPASEHSRGLAAMEHRRLLPGKGQRPAERYSLPARYEFSFHGTTSRRLRAALLDTVARKE